MCGRGRGPPPSGPGGSSRVRVCVCMYVCMVCFCFCALCFHLFMRAYEDPRRQCSPLTLTVDCYLVPDGRPRRHSRGGRPRSRLNGWPRDWGAPEAPGLTDSGRAGPWAFKPQVNGVEAGGRGRHLFLQMRLFSVDSPYMACRSVKSINNDVTAY